MTQKGGAAVDWTFRTDQPIYTHFYSPRWICRMGNYRTYNEANSYCKKLKAMGYKQACVVKGKITVQ